MFSMQWLCETGRIHIHAHIYSEGCMFKAIHEEQEDRLIKVYKKRKDRENVLCSE